MLRRKEEGTNTDIGVEGPTVRRCMSGHGDTSQVVAGPCNPQAEFGEPVDSGCAGRDLGVMYVCKNGQ
jgi:hypothetical protein